MQITKGIHSQRCWIDGKLQEATILFDNDRIADVILGSFSGVDSGIIDFQNAVVMPGAIDAHVHINEPGRTTWEGFETATAAAAAGGITTIVDMPLNSSPVTTNAEAFKQKIKAASSDKLYVNCGFYGGLVPDNLSELEALINCGVLGIKCFLTHSGIDDFPNVGKEELEAAYLIVAAYDIPILAHCELISSQPEKENGAPGDYQQYLRSRPKKWENDAVQLMIELCEKHRVATHIVHVSSADALRDIAEAKNEGLPLTAETCPHYLLFNAENIPDGNTLYKCAPPIRTKANNDKLKKAFKKGTLDFLASDHSPAPPDLKELESGNLIKAWGGISGLQYLLSAAWSSLQEDLSLEEFIPLLTENPARYLGIQNQKGFLKKGMDADITVWSPEENFEVRETENEHRHKISPYLGKTLTGKIQATFVNGIEVFSTSLCSSDTAAGSGSLLGAGGGDGKKSNSNLKSILNKKPGKWILKKQKTK